jgi:hypothetical protein
MNIVANGTCYTAQLTVSRPRTADSLLVVIRIDMYVFVR